MLESDGSIYGNYAMTAEMMRQMEMICIPMPGQAQDLADASQIWSVNASSQMQDLAMELVAYALSTQSWQENTLGRATTNWEVLEKQIQEALLNEEEFGVMTSFIDIHGNEKIIDCGTPAREDMDALRTLLENCQGVSQCDSRIYDAVIEEGQRALSGELTAEEAVKEIEKKVSLYLAE